MENDRKDIPAHLQEQWNDAQGELTGALHDLEAANERYEKAIIARIAISVQLKKWQMKKYYGQDWRVEDVR